MNLIAIPDIKHMGFLIRIKEYMDRDNWSYTIYLTGKKWKRIRAKQGYKTSQEALDKAKDYLNEFANRHPRPCPSCINMIDGLDSNCELCRGVGYIED